MSAILTLTLTLTSCSSFLIWSDHGGMDSADLVTEMVEGQQPRQKNPTWRKGEGGEGIREEGRREEGRREEGRKEEGRTTWEDDIGHCISIINKRQQEEQRSYYRDSFG